MPEILSTIVSTAVFESLFTGGAHQRQLILKRHPRARSFRLRVDPRDGRIMLSVPPRASMTRARTWAESQRGWIEEQLAKLPPPRPIEPDATVPYRGRDIRIDWARKYPRKPVFEADRLRFGGPEEAVSGRVLGWLKGEARRILNERTEYYARRAGVTVARISIGDPRSRWGSCSSTGNIRYSWRLVMMPPPVLCATVAHEVAHRAHMNHGPDFHKLVANLFGRAPVAERDWLRDHGAALYWVGCSS